MKCIILAAFATLAFIVAPTARADARVYIRSVVAGQCPQYLWRF